MSVTFSGWGAAPLKELHLQATELDVRKQLAAIGKREGFDVVTITKQGLYKGGGKISNISGFTWAQDNKQFFYKDRTESLVQLTELSEGDVAKALARHLALPLLKFIEVEGGDLYFGKTKSGALYALVGDVCFKRAVNYLKGKDLYENVTKTELQQYVQIFSKQFGISPQNFHVLEGPIPHDHIDKTLRPLEGSRVLVSDLNLSLELIREMAKDSTGGEQRFLSQIFQSTQQMTNLQKRLNNTAQLLTSKGFEVVRIPGNFGPYRNERGELHTVNYANAVVHQRKNGDLVYMAASSGFPRLDQAFKEQLLKLKRIAVVDFIAGKPSSYGHAGNSITASARNDGGGSLHCMVAERPDFKSWLG